ncbi:MAG: acyl-CoA thioesterase [Archangium sp.]|nr:acyl-CoA thioesterase [Archangium sp.]
MALGSFPVTYEHKVAWAEMDAFGHVNNANYLRWFESARIFYFEQTGISTTATDGKAWVPILGRATVDFRKPVKYPDTIQIAASVTKFGNTSFTMAYRATSPTLGVVAEGEAIVVVLDPKTGDKIVLPAELKAAVEKLEGASER